MGRTYTVQRMLEDTPCITIRGKWLRALGIELGSKIRLQESENMIVLLKIPEEETQRKYLEEKVEHLEQQLKVLKQKLY